MKTALMVVGTALALTACTGGGGEMDAGQMGVTSKTLSPSSGQQFWEGRWSPDGKKIAMHHSVVGSGGADSIGVMDEDGANLKLIADAGTYLASVAWSPDGTTIYFSGSDGILKVPVAGGAVTLVKSSFAAMNIDVSKDGKQLSYSVNGSNNVVLLELADGGQTTVGMGEAARFSPDGTQLAYVARATEPDGGSEEHYKLYKLSDKTITDLGLAGTYLASVCWFPDGKKLGVTSKTALEVLALDQTPVTRTRLFDSSASTGCDVHPDAKRILYRVNGGLGLHVLSGF